MSPMILSHLLKLEILELLEAGELRRESAGAGGVDDQQGVAMSVAR